MTSKVIVVGAGPAGLMAAGRAAELGAQVLLLEKMQRPAAKLRLTGGGRCNLTHLADTDHFLARLVPDTRFLRNAMSRFGPQALMAFLQALGVTTFVEPDGRVFPVSNEAAEVASALEQYASSHGVQIRCGATASRLACAEGHIRGLVLANGESLPADAVILATGGLSYPHTGSAGDGYRMAREVGHTVQRPSPGLVGLLVDDAGLHSLQGIAVRHVKITLLVHGHAQAVSEGELLCTHYGVSGPAVLDASLRLGMHSEREDVSLCVDFFPERPSEQLLSSWRQTVAANGRQAPTALLTVDLPSRLAAYLVERAGISVDQQVAQLSNQQRQSLLRSCKRLELPVAGTRPMGEAFVTLGGVSLPEIGPRSMASRLIKGLYLAGEVINIAGPTGGYNLQIAFTTGRVSGESAAQGLGPP